MPKLVLMTAEEFARLEAELERMKTEGRRQSRDDLKRARAYGDFKENAEFEQAKREQAALEGRILELEETIGRAQVAEATEAGGVAVGATVVVSDLETTREICFSVRATGPCDPGAILVTPQSPIGRSLMGKRVQDDVEVETPSGTRRYRILSVEFVTKGQILGTHEPIAHWDDKGESIGA